MSKKSKQLFWIPWIVLTVIILYISAHIVHINDVSHRQALWGGGNAQKITGLNLIFAGLNEALVDWFNFKGIIFAHLVVVWLGIVFFMLCLSGMKYVDMLRHITKPYWTRYPWWFGDSSNPLIPNKTFFKVWKTVKVKDKQTGLIKEQSKPVEICEDDWIGYRKYMIDPWTEQDQKNGIPDPNFLLGNYPDHCDFNGPVKFSMNPSMTDRNLLTLIFGGSGAGKTFGFLEPNLAQMNCSFAITDPAGEVYENMGKMLIENGYRLWRFSTSEPRLSNCYNPLDYIYTPDGEVDQVKVAQVVHTFINNAAGAKQNKGEAFWTKSAIAWLTFAIMYCAEFLPLEKRNFYQILKLAQLGKADEDSSSAMTQLGRIIEQARNEKPKAKCFEYFDVFNLAPAKTQNSILISIGVDLTPFAQDELKNLTTTSYLCKRDKHGLIKEYIRDSNKNLIRDNDNIDLRTIGDRKTALFIITKTANDAYHFLVSMMYAQLFDILYERAEKISKNRWHIHASNDMVISSQYISKEEAEEVRTLYAEAEVKTETNKGVTKYYVFNKNAGKKYTMPEKLALDRKAIGYLEEVYTQQIGENLIRSYQTATVKHGKLRLPIHTRLLLDEFANITEIPAFVQFLSTMRKYQISCTIILQSLAQLLERYEKSASTIISDCDTLVFLGTPDPDTCKKISDMLGTTIYPQIKYSESKQSNGGSISKSFDKVEKPLMSAAELGRLHNSECIVMIRGLKPMKLKKLSFAEHPNFCRSGADPEHPENKLLLDFTKQHYACLSKDMVQTSRQFEEESVSKQIMNGQSPLKTSTSPIRKRQIGKKVTNPPELAQALGTKTEQLPDILKHPGTIAPDDRNDTGISVPTEVPSNNFDESFSFKDNQNNASSDDANAGTPQSTSPITPDTDTSWMFM